MVPRPHLRIFELITECLTHEYQVYMGSSPHLWFCAFKTATLGPELLVSMGPRPHVCFFLHSKQRL